MKAWGRLRDGDERFGDPLALSLLDEDAGEGEERRNPAGNLLLVVHTYIELSADRAAIRIISRRHPTHREIKSYEDDDPMKDDYDFSTAARGKFFRKGARHVSPVHLEPDVLADLSDLAASQRTSLDDLVSTLLKEDIERIDAAKSPGLL